MYNEKGLGNVLSRSPWALGAVAGPAFRRGEGKPRGLRARNYGDPASTQVIQKQQQHRWLLGPQWISIPGLPRMKHPPARSHNLGSPLLPVKAIRFRPRLPGQHKGKLQPSADPSFSKDLPNLLLWLLPLKFFCCWIKMGQSL